MSRNTELRVTRVDGYLNYTYEGDMIEMSTQRDSYEGVDTMLLKYKRNRKALKKYLNRRNNLD